MKKYILYIVINVAMVTFGTLDLLGTITYFCAQLLLVRLLNSEFIIKLIIR